MLPVLVTLTEKALISPAFHSVGTVLMSMLADHEGVMVTVTGYHC